MIKIILAGLKRVLAAVFGLFGKDWKLVAIAALVAVCGTSLYACNWEKQKHAVASAKVTEAREELRVAQAQAAIAAVRVQEANKEATERGQEVEDAIQSNKDWGSAPVPDDVRDSLCRTIDCGETGEVPSP